MAADVHNIVVRFSGAALTVRSTDPNLLSLANNGGPTFTMALQLGSAAIDAGINCQGGFSAVDQRGYARVWRRAIDLGAYEYGSQPGSNDNIFHSAFDAPGNCQ